ncbi:MAG: AraC family transcriptional regulator [Saprospiraceae bacterium]|nr:helix-turn-helix domain-containing protein [Lewinellaceae bacterium]
MDVFPFYQIGHFINQPDNPTEFELTRFGAMAEPDIDDPHKHTFYEIIWVEAGRSEQVIDYKTYAIEPACLFFISPGQLHHFENWQNLEGGSILFTENFFLFDQQNKDQLFELIFLDNFYINPVLRLNTANFSDLLAVIRLIDMEAGKPVRDARIIRHLLHILLLKIEQLVEGALPMGIAKTQIIQFKTFKNLLDQHFAENLGVSDYAKAMNTTQHQLNRITRAVTNNTATAFIRNRTMLEAKRYLTFTDFTVSEIAAQLNFLDSSYFARIFKKETGLSPLEFKNRMSEKYRNL